VIVQKMRSIVPSGVRGGRLEVSERDGNQETKGGNVRRRNGKRKGAGTLSPESSLKTISGRF